MKRKALVLALLCVMGLAIVGTAQATWYTCTIQQAGIHSNGVYVVYLTDVNNAASTSTPYIIVGANQTLTNGLYAAALTAWANASNVVVDLSAWGAWEAAVTLYASK
ncbi:MAG TPA: hypothetical protein DCY27_05730 [Desulfobacterales bacterium]|nr:hypothetical protein [Desulfobacterales bacterium]